MFDPIFEFMAQVLATIYDVVPNYALSIMLLTLLIMVILTPLTLKGTRSMIAMQRLQPEMKKLQAKYKDDRQKLNEELMAFYKEHKINPLSGCLPLLLQAPVFIVLYRVLYGLTRRDPAGDMGSLVGNVFADGPGATFSGFGGFDPRFLDPSSRMWQDLHNTNEMTSFGIDLSNTALNALSEGFLNALPYLGLVIIIAITSYVQQKQVAGRTPQSQVSPQQQMLVKVLPLIFVFFSLTLPGGVVLYFLVSNLYRVGQQAFITRTMYRDHTLGPIPAMAVESTGAEPPPDQDGAPKGLLGSLGLGKESLPDPKGKRIARPEPNRRPAKSEGASSGSGDKPKPGGKAAKPLAKGGAGTKTETKAPNKKGSANGNGQAKGGRSSTSKGRAPTRAAPKPPVNRARNKRKRK